MADLLAQLNPQQLAAVTAPTGRHTLILAGAGSGKTRVLTTRVAWLIATGQASPGAILAVTFTNKAAREMLARISAMLPINPRGMWIGTFHGLCNRLLRAHHRDAALPPSFQILDSQDQLGAVKRLLRTLNIDDQKHPPKSVQQFINSAKENGDRPDALAASDDHTAQMIAFYRGYDDQCQREGVVDFAELLLRSYELLQRNQLLREHYSERFRHILIDEFQDTNDLQYRWLKLLAGPQTSLFAVGDDDQSIYAFRGANVGNMAAFEREFAGGNLIKLEQNYRSHAHILNAANGLIRQNSRRLGKDLWTDAGEGEPVRVYEALTDGEEAQWLLEEIRALIAAGSGRSEIAVLYRSNAQSRVVEHALFSAGVPYRVYGGLRFFERAEVKHALAYLRLLENPDDDTAFLRVVNFPARGIGARTLELLQDRAAAHGVSLYRAVPTVAGGASAKLLQFVALIEQLRTRAQRLPLTDAIDEVVERSGLLAHYQTEREGQERIENLRELVNAGAAYLAEAGIAADVPASVGLAAAVTGPGVAPVDATPVDSALADSALADSAPIDSVLIDAAPPAATMADDSPAIDAGNIVTIALSPLAGFLAFASLESGDGQAGEGTDAVQMMTVHSAKGLEFNAVFVTGLEEGLFPHENSANVFDGLEEERRLMYVAITRARQRLYLSFSQSRQLHGQTRYNIRSRFFDELPETDLKWLTARSRGEARYGAGGWAGGGSGWSGGRGSYGDGASGGYGSRGGMRSSGGYGGGSYGRGQAGALGGPARPAEGYAGKSAGSLRDARFRIGQGVAHARFGEGVVTGIEGIGDDARIQIKFAGHGSKWLALSIAKLEPIA
ncbi:MAG: UvrD-helicase domain-containing protein [Lautropia sp.]